MEKKNEIGFAGFLRNVFNKTTPIPFKVETVKVAKNSFILNEGDIENYIYCVKEGIVEIGMYHNTSDHQIIDFFFEKEFFCDFSNLMLSKPTKSYALAITDCSLERIHKDDFLSDESDKSLIVNQLLRYLLSITLFRRLRKEELRSFEGEERYLAVISDSPNILKDIPVKKVAKYLNIHPQSLSRIRANINKKNSGQR